MELPVWVYDPNHCSLGAGGWSLSIILGSSRFFFGSALRTFNLILLDNIMIECCKNPCCIFVNLPDLQKLLCLYNDFISCGDENGETPGFARHLHHYDGFWLFPWSNEDWRVPPFYCFYTWHFSHNLFTKYRRGSCKKDHVESYSTFSFLLG